MLKLKEAVDFPVVLVGNKKDLEEQRGIDVREGQELGQTWGYPFFETSAKTNENVNEIFFQLTREITRFKKAHQPEKKKKQKKACLIL